MKNEEIITQWYDEVWNNKNEAFIDKILAPTCIAHGLMDEEGKEVVGPEKFKVLFRKFITSFPDIHLTVVDTVNEGDKIAARAIAQLSHSGTSFEAFPGKTIEPSGKAIEFSGMTITVIRDGQIQEAWNSFDFLGLYAQLGAL